LWPTGWAFPATRLPDQEKHTMNHEELADAEGTARDALATAPDGHMPGGRGTRGVIKTGERAAMLTLATLVIALNASSGISLSLLIQAVGHVMFENHTTIGYLYTLGAAVPLLLAIPAGWLSDRIGSKRMVTPGIVAWTASMFGMALACLAGKTPGPSVAITLTAFVFMLQGLASAAIVPAAIRVIAAWFPATERGMAAGVLTSGLQLAPLLLSSGMVSLPLYAHPEWAFLLLGLLGIGATMLWHAYYQPPMRNPTANRAELEYIRAGDGLIEQDAPAGAAVPSPAPGADAGLGGRTLLAVYLGQYCTVTISVFYVSWLSSYLFQRLHLPLHRMQVIQPALSIIGVAGIIGLGLLSDHLLRRTGAFDIARKRIIVAGLLLSGLGVLASALHSVLAIPLMLVAFLGCVAGKLGMAVLVDNAPSGQVGIASGIFYMAGIVAAVVTPLGLAMLMRDDNVVLPIVYVGAHAVLGALAYGVIAGPLRGRRAA